LKKLGRIKLKVVYGGSRERRRGKERGSSILERKKKKLSQKSLTTGRRGSPLLPP